MSVSWVPRQAISSTHAKCHHINADVPCSVSSTAVVGPCGKLDSVDASAQSAGCPDHINICMCSGRQWLPSEVPVRVPGAWVPVTVEGLGAIKSETCLLRNFQEVASMFLRHWVWSRCVPPAKSRFGFGHFLILLSPATAQRSRFTIGSDDVLTVDQHLPCVFHHRAHHMCNSGTST